MRAAKATIDGPGQRAFVVVSDGSVLAQAIADRLRLLGRAVVVLRRPGPPNFEAACSADRAGSREGWIAMLDQASILGRPTLSIICMLTNGSTAERLCVEASSDVLSLYATLEARQPGRKVCVILLTQGAFELREHDLASPSTRHCEVSRLLFPSSARAGPRVCSTLVPPEVCRSANGLQPSLTTWSTRMVMR